MTKQFFLTAPVLSAPRPIVVRDCTIRLCGETEYSSIEGTDPETLQDTLDALVYALLEQGLHPLRPLRVVIGLRSKSDLSIVKQPPRDVHGWLPWAFGRLPWDEIPLVALTEEICRRVEAALSQNK